ncbi:prepilin-type N-terminal cleavage/methylation domain-containing protein [Sulfitobacter sp. D35]|uniref:prepilin-type N-terminal cleavage/methylation domain-containing protein n=1 Tax=Sulfitobacter sp. D35 TaxID=3083252 RepID=UPI00296FB6B7|nr:prepilin-type N-terminal cleavage/methylation domain-containing protein [Sulfitobacter sp. D35]MDW4500485.1 prepilin-type N-terminal cleavage/methylation domain-containing protein [Sulfitobacter sp. D35]
MDIGLRAKASTSGFSLIELLAVVAVTSILAIGASLIFSGGGSGAARAAEVFRTEAVNIRRLAMLSGIDHALEIRRNGWTRLRANASGDWSEIGSRSISDARAESTARSVRFHDDGRIDAFDVSFKDGSGAVLCRAADGGLPRCALR